MLCAGCREDIDSDACRRRMLAPDASPASTAKPMERTLDPARLGDHLDRLYRAAWALCGSREDAEDLVQETYARVLARPRVLRREDDLGYLLRALRNTFLNQRRSASRRLRAARSRTRSTSWPTRTRVDPTRRSRPASSTARSPRCRTTSATSSSPSTSPGLSYKEAARALRIREGTVMSRLYRARQQVVRRVEGGSA